MESSSIHSIAHRNLIFVHGKGGVGKTSISKALARKLAARARPESPGPAARQTEGRRVLWLEFENPSHPAGEILQLDPELRGLWTLNAEAMIAFEQYAELKIEKLGFGLGALGALGLSRIFTKNRLIQYLAKAAPGIHELVLLGKAWHEREHYDHVVVDMPSTGHALAMFQSTINFARLFGGGPLSRDAEAMLETFRDPARAGHLIVSLPEEMPLRESLELQGHLLDFFPANPPGFLLNRRFPPVRLDSPLDKPAAVPCSASEDDDRAPPFATSIQDYARRRTALETWNLRLWAEKGISFTQVRFFPPPEATDPLVEHQVIQQICRELEKDGVV